MFSRTIIQSCPRRGAWPLWANPGATPVLKVPSQFDAKSCLYFLLLMYLSLSGQSRLDCFQHTVTFWNVTIKRFSGRWHIDNLHFALEKGWYPGLKFVTELRNSLTISTGWNSFSSKQLRKSTREKQIPNPTTPAKNSSSFKVFCHDIES